jgi:hypothetical protein
MGIAMLSAFFSIFGVSPEVLAGGVQEPSQMHQFWPVELHCRPWRARLSGR